MVMKNKSLKNNDIFDVDISCTHRLQLFENFSFDSKRVEQSILGGVYEFTEVILSRDEVRLLRDLPGDNCVLVVAIEDLSYCFICLIRALLIELTKRFLI